MASKTKKVRNEATRLNAPSIKSLAKLYQLAVRREDQRTAEAAEQAVLTLGLAEAAVAESTVLASFLMSG